MSTPLAPKKNTASTWVLSILAVAFMATSFQKNPLKFFFEPTILSIGDCHFKMTEFQTLLHAQSITLLLQDQSLKPDMVTQLAIERELLDQAARDLDIEVSNHAGRKSLENKTLLQENGTYSPKKLEALIARSGMSLKQLIDNEKKTQRVSRLRKALVEQVIPSKLLVEKVVSGYLQRRTGLYKIFRTHDVSITQTPSKEQLLTLFKKKPTTALPSTTFRGALFSLQDEPMVEEHLNAGMSFEDIVKKHSKTVSIWSMDAQGRDQRGKNVLEKTWGPGLNADLLSNLNQLQKNEPQFLLDKIPSPRPEWVRLSQDQYLLVEIVEKMPARVLTFEQAYPILEDQWREEKKREKIQQQAKTFIKNDNKFSMTPVGPLAYEEFDLKHEELKGVRDALFDMTQQESYKIINEKDKTTVVWLSKCEKMKDEVIERAATDLLIADLHHMFEQALVQELLKNKPVTFHQKALKKLEKKSESFDDDDAS